MHIFRSIFLLILLVGAVWSANAQLAYLENRFLNDYTQWELFDYNENKVGTLETRFRGESEINEWNVQLGHVTYPIEAVWPDRLDEWVLRSDNNRVTATIQWTDDYTQWVVSDDTHSFHLRGDLAYNLNIWYLDDTEQFWEIYTMSPNQFGSWRIDDRLEGTSPELKVMLVFIASFYAVRL